MLCPFCREKDTSVVDSRPTEDGTAIRRRRLCGCDRKERFTTFERVQFQELTVIKGNGKREPFDRDKISKSIRIATRKRPIDSETIEKFISKIVRNLEGLGFCNTQRCLVLSNCLFYYVCCRNVSPCHCTG